MSGTCLLTLNFGKRINNTIISFLSDFSILKRKILQTKMYMDFCCDDKKGGEHSLISDEPKICLTYTNEIIENNGIPHEVEYLMLELNSSEKPLKYPT